jgi:hypothetical protein
MVDKRQQFGPQIMILKYLYWNLASLGTEISEFVWKYAYMMYEDMWSEWAESELR